MRSFVPRFWMRAATTASFCLENMRGKHAGIGIPMRRFSINRKFHMNDAPRITIASQENMTLFYSNRMLVLHFFQENIQRQSMNQARDSSLHQVSPEKRGDNL
jgi:hypothetical protein